MIKIFTPSYKLIFIFCNLLLFCMLLPSAQAQNQKFVLDWDGARISQDDDCTLCGDDYACSNGFGQWNNGEKTFTDSLPIGAIITNITVEVFYACAGSAVSVELNGATVGGFGREGIDCECNSCSVSSVSSNESNLLNAYVKNGENTIKLNTGSGLFCADRAIVTVEYTLNNIIQTLALPSTKLCPGTAFPVSYQATGAFPEGNLFRVELSDSGGVFNQHPLVIGSATGVAASGTIEAIIPAGITFGQGYRVRVRASAPHALGKNNGRDLIIGDTSAPHIKHPEDVVVRSQSGSCGSIVNYSVPQATDDCGNPNLRLVAGLGSGSFFPVGITQEAYEAIDDQGNKSICNFNVIVLDDHPPQAICRSLELFLDSTGQATLSVDKFDNDSNDPCGISSRTLSQTNFSCEDLGDKLITLTVRDLAGNIGTCQANIEVLDTLSPVLQVQDITLFLNQEGKASLDFADIDQGSFDNCSLSEINIAQTAFSLTDVGINTVEVSIQDAQGNSSKQQIQVEVKDTISPELICRELEIFLDENGLANVNASEITEIGEENITLSLSKDTFTCEELGTNTVKLTARDERGNTSECTANIQVSDSISPKILCPEDLFFVADADACGATVAIASPQVSDNCGIARVFNDFNQSNDASDFYPVGITSVTWWVEDLAGNLDACTFQVIVEDTLAPSVNNCPADIRVIAPKDSSGAVVSWLPPSFQDNCPDWSVTASHSSGSFFPIGLTQVTYQATDQAGNERLCEFKIEVAEFGLSINSFSLIDASQNLVLGPLQEGDTINLGDISSETINIVANTFPQKVGSVALSLDGPESYEQTENFPPYALFGDFPFGEFIGDLLKAGAYTVTATPYPEPEAQGEAGITKSLQFYVSENYYASFQVEGEGEVLILNEQENYARGSDVIAQVFPAEGYRFVHWVNEAGIVVGNTNPAPFQVYRNFTFTAVLEPIPDLQVDRFVLIDALTGEEISTIEDGSQLVIENLAQRKFNIEAFTSPDTVGSLDFRLGGAIQNFKRENKAPYRLFDDSGETLIAGNYTLEGVPYTESRGGGSAGYTRRIEFELKEPAPIRVTKLLLIDASQDRVIQELLPGTEIPLQQITQTELSIEAITEPAKVGSVQIKLTGPVNQTQLESNAPYTLFGDASTADYFGKAFFAGSYTVSATPYTEKSGSGEIGYTSTLTFQITANPSVEAVQVVNASDGAIKTPLTEGDTIYLAESEAISIRALSNTAGSIAFELADAQGNILVDRAESVRPFSLLGDQNGQSYTPWMPNPGVYTLTLTPFGESRRQGEPGSSTIINFVVQTEAVSSLSEPDAPALSVLQMHPNPLRGTRLQLDFNQTLQGKYLLKIQTQQGTVIHQESTEIKEPSRWIELRRIPSGLNQGVYFVIIESENQPRLMKRIVKY